MDPTFPMAGIPVRPRDTPPGVLSCSRSRPRPERRIKWQPGALGSYASYTNYANYANGPGRKVERCCTDLRKAIEVEASLARLVDRRA